MAISFIGSGTQTGQVSDVTYNFSSLLNSSGAAPTLQSGDLVLVNYTQTKNSNASNSSMLSTGYTEVAGSDLYGGNKFNQLVFYKFITSDTNVVLKGTGSTTDYTFGAIIHVFRGVNQTTPLDVTSTTFTGSNGTTPNPASITPVTAGSYIVVAAGAQLDRNQTFATYPDLSTATNAFRQVLANPGGSFYYTLAGMGFKSDWTSGAFDPGQWTGGNQGVSGMDSGAVTLALREAPTRKAVRRSYWI